MKRQTIGSRQPRQAAKSTRRPAPTLTPRDRVAASTRIVVKVGTNVVMRDDGSASIGVLYGIAESLANLRRAGREVLLVSSGAVGLGAQRLGLASKPTELVMVQACAAIGQSRLMSLYDDAFDKLGYRVAQVLLTEDDFLDAHAQPESARHAGQAAVPRRHPHHQRKRHGLYGRAGSPRTPAARRAHVFGDNDKLSALVMTHAGADLLILLSDVDGLYAGDPQSHGATLVPRLRPVSPMPSANYAKGGNGRGRGGMESKLEAARIANEAGQPAVIANGRTPGIIDMICAGKNVGSLFSPEKRGMNASAASVSPAILALAQAAKDASRAIATSSLEERNRALEAVAQGMERARDRILAANAEDLRLARLCLQRGELSSSLVERLKLSPQKLASMIAGVRAVAPLPDPINRVLDRTLLDNGLLLEKVSRPLGLLAVIFEARPEAVTQIGSLAIKSGNAVILKPGREVEHTARVLVEVIRQALARAHRHSRGAGRQRPSAHRRGRTAQARRHRGSGDSARLLRAGAARAVVHAHPRAGPFRGRLPHLRGRRRRIRHGAEHH